MDLAAHVKAWAYVAGLYIKENWGVLSLWAGSLSLANVQTAVSILSGLAVFLYTVVKTVKLLKGEQPKD